MDLKPFEIDQPRLGYARARVQRKLRPAVVGKRAVRDFDQQSHVGGLRQALEPRHGTGVAAADRRHLDDLTLDELDPDVASQAAGIAHSAILIEHDASPPERDRPAILADAKT